MLEEVYSIEILMNYFLSKGFNELDVILILYGILIKCGRVNMDYLGFKHNTLKSHGFLWDFNNLKIH